MCFRNICVLILIISAFVDEILPLLCNKVCPDENDQFPVFLRLHHFIWSEFMYFRSDIDLLFFFRVQGFGVRGGESHHKNAFLSPIHWILLSLIAVYVYKTTVFLMLIIFDIVYKKLIFLCDKMCPDENGKFRTFLMIRHLMWSECI